MDFSNYEALKAAVATELNRTDLAGDIEAFIRLSEAQTERQLRVRQMVATTTIPVNAELINLPTDFLETRTFVLNTNPVTLLNFRTLDSMAMYKAAFPSGGKPREYTVIGEQFQVLPVPDTTYNATLVYYRTIPNLSATVTTNWLLAKAPDIYFYGALVNSAPYLRDDERITTWATYYQNAVDALRIEDDRAQTSAGALKQIARQF